MDEPESTAPSTAFSTGGSTASEADTGKYANETSFKGQRASEVAKKREAAKREKRKKGPDLLGEALARAEAAEAGLAEVQGQLAEEVAKNSEREAKGQLKVALARVAELEKEVAEFRAAKEEVVDDPGDRLSDELIQRCLEEAGRE